MFDTLHNKYDGTKCGHKTVFSETEENRLADWVVDMSRIGYGRTREELLTTVQNILDVDNRVNPFKNNKPGKDWFYGFLKRHPSISVWTPLQLGKERAIVTPEKIVGWHQNFLDYFGSSDKTQINVMPYMSASGHYIPPMLVFPGKRFTYNVLEGFERAAMGRSDNGWMDSVLFVDWLRDVFIPSVKHQGVQFPVLLFVDGHSTHITWDASEICKKNDVILYCLQEHASHLMQPLDLRLFSSLKENWKQAVRQYQMEHVGDFVTKQTFARVFKSAWVKSTTVDIAIHGFRDAGLFPLNADVVLNTHKLIPSTIFCSEKPESTTNVSSSFSATNRFTPQASVSHGQGESGSTVRPTVQISQPSTSTATNRSTPPASTYPRHGDSRTAVRPTVQISQPSTSTATAIFTPSSSAYPGHGESRTTVRPTVQMSQPTSAATNRSTPPASAYPGQRQSRTIGRNTCEVSQPSTSAATNRFTPPTSTYPGQGESRTAVRPTVQISQPSMSAATNRFTPPVSTYPRHPTYRVASTASVPTSHDSTEVTQGQDQLSVFESILGEDTVKLYEKRKAEGYDVPDHMYQMWLSLKQTSISPFGRFLNVPCVPQRKKKRGGRTQSLPKAITGDAYRQILQDGKRKKEEIEQLKVMKRTEREEKRKKKEENREQKKRVRDEKRRLKEAEKERGRADRRMLDTSEEEDFSLNDSTDVEMTPVGQTSKFYKCELAYDNRPLAWISCEKCERLFHLDCTDVPVDDLTPEEIMDFPFECLFC
ncbi:uncharacterized protein LOC124276668 [Haliotis rubra]|uniref:uncharacterized protein LOC124276668 n=1 Tax=Haliotis rubra TaxID=36100 RepID=UPI001EE540E8|nr:uncharacterized protein LOC124276668 [Haliotis rubra]